MAKVALIHYWLTGMRGGENVLADIIKSYPDADIFTHVYTPKALNGVFERQQVVETLIAHLPFGRKLYRKYLPLMPTALKRLNLSDYDLIISSESGPAKGIRKPKNAVHVCYCHTPMRYLWDMFDDYYNQAGFLNKIGMRVFKNYLRHYDLESAKQVDYFIANSSFVKDRIKKIYNRESVVIYPPVNSTFFSEKKYEKKDFYLYAGQLISYKNPELAIQACQKLNRKLVLIGEGDLKLKLQNKYKDTVIFKGRVSQEELRKTYAQARALIFPGIEDFGIVPLEAQAAGTPVIALGIGGALETVVNHKTGLFFDVETSDALAEAILKFEKMEWDPAICKEHSRLFSEKVFLDRFQHFISAIYKK